MLPCAEDTEVVMENPVRVEPVLLYRSAGQTPGCAPNLSIIIATHNRKDLVIQCLASLQRVRTPVRFEAIVVDNGSTDQTSEAVAGLAADLTYGLTLLRNEANLGFAIANNQGAARAGSPFLLFLNNDTRAEGEFLARPLAILASGKVGIVGIQLRFEDGLIQHAGVAFDDRKSPFHIFRMYEPGYQPAARSRYAQAVTGGCMFVPRDLFLAAGGFDEAYVNGWEDLDLCFKVRALGRSVYYCGEVWLYHLESQTPSRLDGAAANEARFRRLWQDQVVRDARALYNAADSLASATSRKARLPLPTRIRFAINIGVPDRSHNDWGDIFFARSLSRALKDLGHHCTIRYLNEWDQPGRHVDVVIHLKGLSPYLPRHHHVNVLWVINHPELHSVEELNTYDLVLAASCRWSDRMKSRVRVPLHYTPQAGDEKAFFPSHKEAERDIDVLFVGNNYNAVHGGPARRVIADLLSCGESFNFKVVGRHWSGFVEDSQVLSEFVPWDQLPALYRRAKIVLNDHQDSMRSEGFVNNRTFDLAHLKAFQISDDVAGLSELGVTTYQDAPHLRRLIRHYLDHPDERRQNAEKVYAACREYTFAARAESILAKLKALEAAAPPVECCDICGYSGSGFLDMGQRRGVRCPICNSLERQRALWFLLNRDGHLRPGLRVLEISPLTGSLFRDYLVAEGCSYYCCDKWKTGNPLDRRDSSFVDIQTDVAALAFSDGSFDLVLMQHVIEEVPDDVAAFREIARVLKPTGTAILEIPYHRHVRETREFTVAGAFGNVRAYGADVYQRLTCFGSREEAIVDGICFSILKKNAASVPFCFPVLLDHPASEPQKFEKRLGATLDRLERSGFTPLTIPQVSNLVTGLVQYRRPAWITFDDGQKQDITGALPMLCSRRLPAASFIIPGRMTAEDWERFAVPGRDPFLQIGSHSLTHRLVFRSPRLIDIWTGQPEYRNLFLNGEPRGHPVFEYSPALMSRRLVLLPVAVKFCRIILRSTGTCGGGNIWKVLLRPSPPNSLTDPAVRSHRTSLCHESNLKSPALAS
jgi:GT2 family glycosyltransferase/SAM-dependent methyltransferase